MVGPEQGPRPPRPKNARAPGFEELRDGLGFGVVSGLGFGVFPEGPTVDGQNPA